MTYNEIWQSLTHIYDESEAKAITRLMLETRFGLSVADIYAGKVNELSEDKTAFLIKIIARLEQSEPIQYVLGTSWFCGRQFNVTHNVLIPRPETEDLCEWILSDMNTERENFIVNLSTFEPVNRNILDIGCGSGCIAITLALDTKEAKVTAWDISIDALNVARGNALRLGAHVYFEQKDALNLPEVAEKWDVIVSNPPYICRKESSMMQKNVLDYEPDIALFVPDNDPLKFYRSISIYSARVLKVSGSLYFETNTAYVNQVVELLKSLKFNDIKIRQDRYGKPRFVKGIR